MTLPDTTKDAEPADDPLAETQRVIAGRLTRNLAWTGVVVALVGIPTVLVTVPEQVGRLVVSSCAGLVGLTGFCLLARGWNAGAAAVVVWGLWVVMACGGIFNGGVSAPAMAAILTLTTFATLALGLRHGLVLCAASALLCITLLIAERQGMVYVPVPPELRATIYIVLGVMSAFMLWSTASMLRSSALAAHAEAARRATAERQLQASEECLRVANAELEMRIADRTAQLAAANRELEAFSYSVAHDLRAPLRAIDGFTAGLADDLASVLNDDGKRDVGRIRNACQRMSDQIDGLLRLSRLTRAEMKRRPTDLSAIATTVVDALRLAQPGRVVDVAIEPGVMADADPDLVRVLFENLIGNAWKYSSRTSAARIEFGCEPGEGGSRFFVRDNGVGFDMAYAGKLFTAFQRLHGSHEFEGNGIGLATVQRIVNRHGGRVWAEAAVGKGATFRFTLPTPV